MNLANCLRETEDGGHGFNQHFQCCVGVMAHGGRQRNEPLVERFRRPGFVFCGLKGRMVIAAGSPEISFRTRLGHHWLGVGVGSGAPQTLKWPGRGETTPRPPFADAFVGWVPLPCPTPVKAAQSPVRLGKYQVRTPSSEVAVTKLFARYQMVESVAMHQLFRKGDCEDLATPPTSIKISTLRGIYNPQVVLRKNISCKTLAPLRGRVRL